MPAYNLTGPQQQILTSWLFEEQGYLDFAYNIDFVSARQALAADPSLDVREWIRTNQRNGLSKQANWDECAMVWWIRANNGVNITPPNRPPERTIWIPILEEWRDSIIRAFAGVGEAVRNQKSVEIAAEDGSISTMPSGQNLVHQRNMIDNVLSVM